MHTTTEISLPPGVRAHVRRFSPHFGGLVEKYALQRMQAFGPDTTFTMDDVQDCISLAYGEYISQKDEKGAPDFRVMENSLVEFRSGRSRPVEDILDELQGRGSSGG